MTAPPCLLCGTVRRRRLDEATRIVRVPAPRFLTRCVRCGLVSIHPLPTSLELRSLYADDTIVRQYHEAYGWVYVMGDVAPAAHMQRRLDVLERILGGSRRILDVGAASGVFLALARSRGWDITGIEPSEPAVREAQARFGIELIHGSLEDSQLPETSFDAAHMSHVLEHIRDPLQALREVRGVLRPGGVVVLEVPNEFGDLLGSIRSTLGRPREPYPVPSPHTYFFTPSTLKMALARAGFRTIRLTTPRRNRDVSSHIPFGGVMKRAIYTLEAVLRRGPLIEVFAVAAR